MTAATTTTVPRPTVEEQVDRLIDTIVGERPPTTSPVSASHEGRRRRRAGDLDGALRVFAE